MVSIYRTQLFDNNVLKNNKKAATTASSSRGEIPTPYSFIPSPRNAQHMYNAGT
jgi:hypothetical protein